MKIGIMTSGGDSPGMNSLVINLIRLFQKNEISFELIEDGFKGLINNSFIKCPSDENLNYLENLGGSFIGCGRLPELKQVSTQEKIVRILKEKGIDTIVVIGGDGSMIGGYSIHKKGIRVINVPGTIDNNITSSDYSLGYYSALEANVQSINQIIQCAKSHKRFFFIQVMGGYASNLAVDTAIATNADYVITHEAKWSENQIIDVIKKCMKEKKYGFMVFPDLLIEPIEDFIKKIQQKSGFEIRLEILGRIQRGANVSGYDKVIASKWACQIYDVITKIKESRLIIEFDNKTKDVEINYSILEQNKNKTIKGLEIFKMMKGFKNDN